MASATEQLRAMLGLPRYPGMDAFAQEQAERGGPLDRGPYAMVVSTVAETPSEARDLIRGHNIEGYTMLGIGLHNDYWILVLS